MKKMTKKSAPATVSKKKAAARAPKAAMASKKSASTKTASTKTASMKSASTKAAPKKSASKKAASSKKTGLASVAPRAKRMVSRVKRAVSNAVAAR